MRGRGLIILGLIATPALAQVGLVNPTTEIHDQCVAQAAAANEVTTANGETSYVCTGATAEKFFGISTGERVVNDKNGVFVARYYAETGYCAHQIKDSASQPVSAYVCEVVVPTAK